MACRYDVDCVVANILMTRYDEIRLVFNKKSDKNKEMRLMADEENELAAVELFKKNSELPLEYSFIPRLIEGHDLYIASTN